MFRYFRQEMRAARDALEHRSGYYHSQMDMEMLLKGTLYEEMPESNFQTHSREMGRTDGILSFRHNR